MYSKSGPKKCSISVLTVLPQHPQCVPKIISVYSLDIHSVVPKHSQCIPIFPVYKIPSTFPVIPNPIRPEYSHVVPLMSAP